MELNYVFLNRKGMIKKSILIWLSIIPLAFLNGAFRDEILTPLLGITVALPISGIILCLFIFVVSFILIPKIGKGTARTYWTIGGLWVVLTILFETIVGLVRGNTIGEIISAYNITTGNLWLLVVVFMGVAPWLIMRIKQVDDKQG